MLFTMLRLKLIGPTRDKPQRARGPRQAMPEQAQLARRLRLRRSNRSFNFAGWQSNSAVVRFILRVEFTKYRHEFNRRGREPLINGHISTVLANHITAWFIASPPTVVAVIASVLPAAVWPCRPVDLNPFQHWPVRPLYVEDPRLCNAASGP